MQEINLLNRFILHKEFIYIGSLDSLETKIGRIESPIVRKRSDKEYIFQSGFSIGTILFMGTSTRSGINIIASISEINSSTQRITFSSGIRIAEYIIAGIFLLYLFIALQHHESLNTYLIAFALWPVCHIWFRFIYRIQERILLSNVVGILQLQDLV